MAWTRVLPYITGAALGCMMLFPLASQGADNGAISGNVTDASSHAPIEGAEVCAHEADTGEFVDCESTDASGDYTIAELPSGTYKVAFYGWLPGYITQYYDGASSWLDADTVSVAAGTTTPSIDAEVQKGGQITGTVVDAVSKAGMGEIEVCAYETGSEFSPRCDQTESSGEYTISGLPSGSFKVKFSPPFSDHTHARQYYDGKPSLATANPVSVTAEEVTSGIDAEMLEGGKITGTVTSAGGGSGVENISVCAIPANFELGGYSCGFTNSSGVYTISGLSTGSYSVQFNGGLNYVTQYYNGKSSTSEATAVSVTNAMTTPSINATLQAAGQIKGKTINATSKAAINSIEVCAIKASDSYPTTSGCTTSFNGGEYTLGGLPAGSYKLRFAAGYGEISPGVYGQLNYLTQFYSGRAFESEADSVAVVANSATSNVNAEMHEGGKISGTVVGAPSKVGLENTQVCASSTNHHETQSRCAYTNSDGEYTISGFPTGSYKLRFSPSYKDPYVAQYYDDKPTRRLADPVSVTAGSTTPNIDAELHEGGKITGTVVDAVSKAPIANIEVCASPAASCSTTNSSGKYTLSRLQTGSYRVRFFAGDENPSYVNQYYNGKSSWEAADLVAVNAGATTSSIDVEMHKGGKITGTVVDAVSKAGARYVEVCADQDGSDEYFSCGDTDASGHYSIDGLPSGSYRVSFSPGYYEGGPGSPNYNYLTEYYNGKPSADAADPVSVTAGSTTANIDAEMHEGGKISGTVVGAPSKAGLRYVEACAFQDSSGEYFDCGFTDENGNYTIEGLGSGPYTVTFWPTSFGLGQSNYLPQSYNGKPLGDGSDPVSVAVGSTTANINAELHPGGQIKGTVTDASNSAPLQYVNACAIEASDEEEVTRCAQTSANGTYTISGLKTGSYKVKFSAIYYEYEEGPFEEEVVGEEEYATQYYNSKSSLAEANPISVTAGGAVAGIDARMEEPAGASTKPVNTEAPVLSGVPAVGEVLSCSQGAWSASPTGYSYRWLRDGVAIPGKTATTYTIQSADQDHGISCEVVASNSKGSTSATSNEIQVPAEGTGGTQHTLAVSLTGTGSGSVASSPTGIDCGPSCSHPFASGSSIVLTPTPASGSTFAGWSGGCSGTSPCHVTLDSDISVTAVFNAVGESGGGGVGGGGGSPSSGVGASAASPTSVPPPAASVKPASHKCKKGYKAKKLHGKTKCVKAKPHKPKHKHKG